MVYVGKRADQPVAPQKKTISPQLAVRRPLPYKSSKQCVTCHTAIGAEWRESRHAQAWGHPHLPNDPKKLECSPCHIPQPIYETGLTQREQVRADRFEEGVDCITCHVKGDACLGPGPTREASCNPTHEPTISQSITCSPCHAFHGSLEEWRRSRFFTLKQGCQHCHMPKVRRPLVKGGPVREGRSHRFLGGHSVALLKRALTIGAGIEDGQLVVTLLNDKTGHAVPGEISHREVVLEIVITNGAGQATTGQTLFKAPPRPKRKVVKGTQIQPGQRVVVRKPLPAGGGRVLVRVFYKLYGFYPDETGTEMWRKELIF